MTTSEPPKILKCHSCLKSAPAESVGGFLLYGVTQWSRLPLFAFKMCQECFDRLKGNVEAELAEMAKPKIEVVQ